jgi:integrase
MTDIHDVKVHPPHKGGPGCFDHVALRLGHTLIPGLEGVKQWYITVNGRPHTASFHWLKKRSHQSESTGEASARNLAKYIRFLIDERGLFNDDERYSDVMVVTEDDVLAYKRHCTQGDDRMKPQSWNKIAAAIKLFHIHVHSKDRLDLALPFPLNTVTTQDGYVYQSTGLSVPDKAGSKGTPLTPDFADILLQGAKRLDSNFNEHDGPAVMRDWALVSHALATGMRRESLAMATIYEIPDPNGTPLVVNLVPDATAKGGAGSQSLAFEYRIKAVRAYIAEFRPAIAAEGAKHHKPERPLHLLEATNTWWKYADHDGEVTNKRPWAQTDSDMRRRIVLDDGSSPLVHLTMHGTPMELDTVSKVVADARDFAVKHIDQSFPDRFRLHDCRHTFAVHLALACYLGAVARWVDQSSRFAYKPAALVDAIDVVQASLGHSSQTSTQLYLTHAAAQLAANIPAERYIGPTAY